jgi:hypothetical protein
VGKSHFLENHFVEKLACAFGGHVYVMDIPLKNRMDPMPTI